MLEVKVKKEDLQAKIKEEILKLESEWCDALYEDTESAVVEDIERCRIINNEWFRNTYGGSNDLEYEEFRYDNASKKMYLKALLSAIRRKDKLLNLSMMFSLVSDTSIGINEGTYNFLYNESGCEKPVYKPFKETKIYELLKKQVQEREVPECDTDQGYGFDKVEPLPTRVVQERYRPSKQETYWMLWLIAIIITGLILLFIFK